MRQAFQVESLEQRILLSADPAGAAAQLLSLRDGEELHVDALALGQQSLTALGQATQGATAALPVLAVGSGDEAEAPAAFAVDAPLSAGGAAVLDLVQPADVPADDAALRLSADAEADLRLDAGRFDAARLIAEGALDAVTTLVVDAGATLGGSGRIDAAVLSTGTLAPGYSPGRQEFTSGLQLAAASVTQIELGGTTAGSGYDQLVVTGGATLAGKLELSLYGGYVPQVGDSFTFLTFDTLSGGFGAASGLVDTAHGLIYKLQQESNALRLVVHSLDTGTAALAGALTGNATVNSHLLADDDVLGMAMNAQYFAPQLASGASLAVSGSLALDGALSLSGTVGLGFQTDVAVGGQQVDAWQLSVVDGSGRLGPAGGPALSFSDADAALLWLDSRSSSNAWMWAQGQVSGLSLQGGHGATIAEASLALDLALGLGSGNDTLLDLSSGPLSLREWQVGSQTWRFDGAETSERVAVAGSATLNLAAGLSLSGSLGLVSDSAGLLLAGSGLQARVSAGSVSLGLDSASFGLLLPSSGSGFALEASGALHLSGGGFASATASSATLRMNTTGATQAARSLVVGDFSFSFVEIAPTAAPVVSIVGLQASLGDGFRLLGDFRFEKDATTGDLEVLAQSAGVRLAAGGFYAGVSGAQVALVVRANGGGTLLEASGALDAALGDALSASADQVSVRWNSGATDVSGSSISVAGASHTFGLLEAGRQEVALDGARLAAGDFLRLSGDFAFLRSSTTVKLATDTAGTAVNEASDGLLVDLLTLGGAGLSASAGIVDGPSLELAGVQFGVALMSARDNPNRKWTSVIAEADDAELGGISDVTLRGQDLRFRLNRADGAGDAVVNYASGATALSVATGGSGNIAFDMAGSDGALTEARGRLNLSVGGFVQLEGELAVRKSSSTVTLAKTAGQTTGEEVDVELLTIGGTGLSAFAGVNGGTDDAVGLQLTGVEFGLALASEAADTNPATTARTWTTLQATATSVSMVGMPEGLVIEATGVEVAVNQAGGTATTVIDYGANATELSVATGSAGSSLDLSIDGALGETLRASGHLELDVFGFVQLEGDLAFEKRSATVTLAKTAGQTTGEEVDVELLTIGGTGLSAFAGVNGGTDDAVGLQLTGVEFGLALASEAADTNPATTARTWTTLQATATSVSMVGMPEGLVIEATGVEVAVNQAGGTATTVIDYGTNATDLSVATGSGGSSLDLSIDGALGETLRASGHLELDVFGFVQLEGDLAFEKRSATVTLARTAGQTTGEEVDVELLTIGGSGLDAFAGVNGGSADRMGLALDDISFGLVLAREGADPQRTTPARSWTTLQVQAAAASVVGLPDGMVLRATTIEVAVNQAGGTATTVIDYGTNATELSVATGSGGSSLDLSIAGTLGETLRASAAFEVDLFGFVRFDGELALEKSTRQLTLAGVNGQPGQQISAEVLTLGGHGIDVFVGVDGGTADEMGLRLSGIDIGLALVSATQDPTRKWTALSAQADSIGFVGLSDLLPTAQNLSLQVNQAGRPNDVVIDFATQELAVATGSGQTITLDMAGSSGELLRAEADVTLQISNFAYLSGRIGFEQSKPTAPLVLSNNLRVQPTSMLAITGQDITAFVGYADGGFDRNATLTSQASRLYGFGVEGLDFGLLTLRAGGQSYLAAKARMDDARLYGFDPSDFEFSFQGLSLEINQAAADGTTVNFAASFSGGLALGSSGDVVLDYGRGERFGVYAERATLAISQFLYFSGAIGFERADYGNTLRAGTLATPVVGAKGFTIGGADITAFVGYAENGIDRDKTLAEQADSLYGFGIDGLDFGLLSLRDSSGNRYTALSAHADHMAVYGFDADDFQLSVSDLNVEFNSASLAGRELNFTGGRALEVRTGGEPVTLDFKGDRIGVFAGQATLQLSQFIFVQGAIGFQKADFGLLRAGALPVPNARGFTIGGADIDVFAGYASAGFDASKTFAEQADTLYGFGAEGIDFGLMQVKGGNGVSYTALKAHADTVALYGFDAEDFQLSARGVDFKLNTASTGPALNFLTSFPSTGAADPAGYDLPTGGDPVLMDMTGTTIGVSLNNATLRIAEFVHVSGAFAFEKGGTQLLSAKTLGGLNVPVVAEGFTVGASHVQAFVGVGGPYRTDSNGDGRITTADDIANADAIGLVVDDFSFGLGLFRDKALGTRYVSLKADANQIGFLGFGEVIKFNLEDVHVGVNVSNNPLFALDFTHTGTGQASTGLSIPTGDDPVVLDFDSERIEATVGHATASVAGIVSLEGGFTFQKRKIDAIGFHGLGMNLTLGADALIVAGQNIQAFAGIRGPYLTDSDRDGDFSDETPNADAIGFAINDLDFALALVSPSLGVNTRLPLNFFALDARAASAGLVGTDPFLTLEATDVHLAFNGAIARGIPIPTVYADFSVVADGHGLDIPIGGDLDAITLRYDSNLLGIGLTARLGIFNLFDISTSFDFMFELPEIDFGIDLDLSNISLPGFAMPELPDFDPSMLLPSISLSGLTDLIPDLSASAPDWLLDGIKFLKDIDIRIGLTGIFGSITLPDLTINLGDFVHFQGDFKLTLGQTFTADVATGIDPLLGSAVDAAIDGIAGAIVPGLPATDILKFLFDISDDYSTIRNVSFKGVSFGASDVNMFVGLRDPDFSRPLSQQDGLVGFGLQDLDLALGHYKAELPAWLGATAVTSLTVHADELGVYGLGDLLKIIGSDITVGFNAGGETVLGPLMSARPVYTSIRNSDGTRGLRVATGGTPVLLQFEGSEFMGLDIGLADIAVADFLFLRGSLAFRMGDVYQVAVDAGGLAPMLEQIGSATGTVLNPLPLQVSALTLGGANLTGFAGIGGPYRYGEDLTGPHGAPDGILDGVNASAVGIEVTNVDFGLAIMTPTLATMIPGLEEFAPKFISAKASVESASLVGVDPDILEVRAEDVEVNINTFVLPIPKSPPQLAAVAVAANAALQLFGPPSINYKLSPSFKDFTEDANSNGTLDAGEDRNQNGKIDSAGFALPAGGDNMVFLDFTEEIIQAKIGYAEINLAGFAQLSASMALTKRGSERVTLNNGEETIVTSLALGINDANAFIGIPIGGHGYFYDSNGDQRIDEHDQVNEQAVGLVIRDLDLGLVLAKELVIDTTGIDVGVYLAGRATVDAILLSGVPGAEAHADDLAIEINTGARFSLNIGQFVKDPTTGAVSYDTDVNVSVSLTTIDFSKSTWVHPDDPEGTTRPGYAIDTGNPREPIVLTYNQQFLRLYGMVEVDLFGLVSMDGVLDFRLSETEGLTAFANVEVQIGPDGFNLRREATGLIVINSGGVALRMNLSADLDLGPVAQLDAELDLSLNTFGRAITYEVPEPFRPLTGFDTFTISAYPPGKDPSWTGAYAALTGQGTLDLFDGALALQGDFSVIVAEVQGAVTLELGITAQLDLPVLEPLGVTGTLGLVIDGSNTGLYGALEVGGANPQSKIIDGGSVFSVAGQFLLQVNTTNQAKQVRGRDPVTGTFFDSNGRPAEVSVGAHTLRLSGRASIEVGPIELRGAVDLLIDNSGVQAAMDVTLDLGDFGEIGVSGAAAFGVDATNTPFFALKVQTHVQIGVSVMNISADATLQINTSSLAYTTLHGDVIAANTLFDLELDGTLKVLAFDVDFHGRMSVVDSVFKLEFDGSLNFFNALQIEVGGYITSEGAFEIRGKAEINIYLGPLHLNAGMSVLFSSQPRFAAAAWGSLDFELDLGLFEIDFTIAGFRGEIDITPASAYLAARATVMGITVSGSYTWRWGAPPDISHLASDGTLYLHMGDQSGRYGSGTLYDDTINESFNIDTSADGSQILVRSLGETDTYSASQVRRIVAYGGKGNDFVYVDRRVNALLDFDGGSGNDGFMVLGGATGSQIRGGAGKDEFVGGGRSGLYFWGGDGNDQFIGGDGADIVDMGAGENTIFGGGGNDQIRVNGAVDTVDAGSGDDLITTTLAGVLRLTAGQGNDRLVVDNFSSTAPIQLNDHALVLTTGSGVLRTASFDDSLEQVTLNDAAATTALRSGTGASWGATDLVLDAAGVLDVTQARLVAPQALFSVSAAGISGTLNTELAELSVVNRGTAGAATDDIVVHEADNLDLVSAGRSGGGLSTPSGHIDVALAGREALLTLQSGTLSTGSGGGAITLVADDIDFASGDNRVAGLGLLTIRSASAQQHYRLGSAAQSMFGRDSSTAGATGSLDLSMRDLSALANGFTLISVGHAGPGVLMRIGDIEDATVGQFSFSARLDDEARLFADRIEVVGDVQSSQRLTLDAGGIKIERQNIHDPNGAPDSGLRAPQLLLQADEQILLSGWAIADLLLDISVTASTGIGGYVTYGSEVNSFTADQGSTLQTLGSGSLLRLVTSHSVVSATGMFAGVNNGTDARIEVQAGTGLTLLEGGTVATRHDRGAISLQADAYIHLLSGSAVVSGARFDDNQRAYLTGAGSTLELRTDGELTLAGSLTAAGAMTLDAGEVQDEFADYFNTLPGNTYEANGAPVQISDAATIAAVLSALNAGAVHADLRALFSGGQLTLDSGAQVVSVANYVAFADLPEATRHAIARANGYTVYTNGGFFNPSTGRFYETIASSPVVGYTLDGVAWGSAGRPADGTPFASLSAAQQQAVAAALGYTRYSGTVYFNASAPAGQAVRSGFLQGVSADYNNADIDWAGAGVAAPAAGTAFSQLSGVQKLVVANALGYRWDYDQIPLDAWSGVAFDYRTVSRADWIAASTLNYALAIGNADWGSVAKPASGTLYAELTAEQRAVVDRVVQFVPQQTDRLTLSGSFAAGQQVALTVNGQRVAYTVTADDVVADAATTRANVARGLAAALNADGPTAAAVTATADGELLRVRSDLADTLFTLASDDSRVAVEHNPFDELNLDQQLLVAARLRPALDVAYRDLTAAQQQVVARALAQLEAGGSTLQFFNYSADPGKKLVTGFTQGLVTDYTNEDIVWGAAGAPAAGTAFAQLSAAQQDVVARALGYERYTGVNFFKDSALASQRWVSGFTEGGGAYDLSKIEFGGVAAPAAGTGFEQLSVAQRAIVLTDLGYDAVDQQVYVKAEGSGLRVVDGFTAGTDYDVTTLDWAGVTPPAADAAWGDLALDQQDRVLAVLGYSRWDGLVFHKASAAPDARWRLSFTEGSDYSNASIRWSRVDVPAAGTAFDALSAEQQALVLEQAGLQRYSGTVYVNTAAAAGHQLVTSFTVDYSDPDAPAVPTKRWLLDDGSHRYLVYAEDSNNDGTTDRLLVQAPHALLGQRGAGFLLTGTITTLQDNADFVVDVHDDALVVGGQINLLGQGSDLVIRSDRSVYWQGQAEVHGDITLEGRGAQPAGAPLDGVSVYVHAASALTAQIAGGDITITGAADVELHGALVAGGVRGNSGVTWLGSDSTVTVTAGQQILVNNAIAAAKSVRLVTTGTPGADDGHNSVYLDTVAGLTAAGYTSDGSGGLVEIQAVGGVQLGGMVLAGGRVTQQFNSQGRLVGETIDWSAEASTVRISAGGQLNLGVETLSEDGDTVEVGARVRANARIALAGGANADHIGVRLPGSAVVAAADPDGVLDIDSAQDAWLMGQLLAGGEVLDHYDSAGFYLGSTLRNFGGDSAIRIRADEQVRLGRDLLAGLTIDVRGGRSSHAATTADPWGDEGLVVGGNVSFVTWQENSSITLSASGDLSVLTPAWTQELLADGFAEFADGHLSAETQIKLIVDNGSNDYEAVLTLGTQRSGGNNGLASLVADLQAQIDASALAAGNVTVRLDDGRLKFTSNREMRVEAVSGGGAQRLGFTQVADAGHAGATSGDTTSSRPYAIDAAQAGSVVNLGRANAPAGTITIAGAIRAHSGINMYAGTSATGALAVNFSSTSLIETLSGSMVMNPAGNVTIEGSFIARGANADIYINGTGTLTLAGDLTAQRDIVINAGSRVQAGEVSLRTTSTASFQTLDLGSRIVMAGMNDVQIGNTIGRDSPGLALVQISALHGDLSVLSGSAASSGWIESDASIVLSGRNVDVAGVLRTNGATAADYDYELSILADEDVRLHGAIGLLGSMKISAGDDIDIWDMLVNAQAAGHAVRLEAGDAIRLGNATGHSGAVVLEADRRVDLLAEGVLALGTNAQVYTSGAGSVIAGEGATITVAGALRAGRNHIASYDPAVDSMAFDASVQPQSSASGRDATVTLQAQRELVVGDLASGFGGRIDATGTVTLKSGTAVGGTGFEMTAASAVVVDATGGGAWLEGAVNAGRWQVVQGAQYSISVGARVFSQTALAADTLDALLDRLVTAIDGQADLVAQRNGAVITITGPGGAALAETLAADASFGGSLGSATVTPANAGTATSALADLSGWQVVAGARYTLTVGGTAFSVDAVAGATTETLARALARQIDNTSLYTATRNGSVVTVLRELADGTTALFTGTLTASAAASVGSATVSQASSAALSEGQLSIVTDGDLLVRGSVTAVDTGSDILLRSRSMIDIGGRVSAQDTLTLRGGIDSTGIAIYVQEITVDGAGNYVSGGTLDTAAGGTLDIESVDGITVTGVVGEREVLGATLGQAKVGTMRIVSQSGDVTLMRNVNVRDNLTVQGRDVNLVAGSYVYATGAHSTLYLAARDDLQMSGRAVIAGLDPAIAKAGALLHFVAPDMNIDGTIEVTGLAGRALLNASGTVTIGGTLVSAGDITVNAGVNLGLARSALEGSITRSQLSGGSITVRGQGVVDAVGTVTLRAGGTVTLDADATVATMETVLKPVYQTVERTVDVVVGTVKVAAGTTQVPVVSYVDTEITEQVGTERVVVGSRYETMNVTLSQIGYYNPNAPDDRKFLEVLVEGVHYLNDSTRAASAPSYAVVVDWSDAGNEQVPIRSVAAADRPSGDYTRATALTNKYLSFAQLSDAQRWAVLNSTGYMPLYSFGYSDWKLNVTVNGTASQLSEGAVTSDGVVRPSWKPNGVENGREVYYVDVANWRDKYILMPQGAQEAILSVASQGEARYLDGDTSENGQNNGNWVTLDEVADPSGELVGHYSERAQVLYEQEGSAFRAGRWENGVYIPGTLEGAVDNDDTGATWKARYYSDGTRLVQLSNGLSSLLGTSGTTSLTLTQNPYWSYSGSSNTSDAIASAVDASSATTSGIDGNIYWTDWTGGSQNNGGNSEYRGTAGTVGVTYTGEALGLNWGGKSWSSGNYTGAGVNNGPSGSADEYVSFYSGNQRGRITFSQPVINPVIAVMSLGSSSDGGMLWFGNEDFTIVTGGTNGGWGGGSLNEGQGGSVYNTNEGNGVIRFNGVFTSIDFVIADTEWYGNFTVGFDEVASSTGGVRASNVVVGPSDYVDAFDQGKVKSLTYVSGSEELRKQTFSFMGMTFVNTWFEVGYAPGYDDYAGGSILWEHANYGGGAYYANGPWAGGLGWYDNEVSSVTLSAETKRLELYWWNNFSTPVFVIDRAGGGQASGSVSWLGAWNGVGSDDWNDDAMSYKAWGYRYEQFKNYRYNWESADTQIYDRRVQLSYGVSTQAEAIYDYRPVYKTSIQKVKVEQMQTVTVWEEQPVYAPQQQLVREVFYEEVTGRGEGSRDSISGGNVTIEAGTNVAVSGRISAEDTLRVDAGALINLDGKLLPAGDGSQLTTRLSGNEIVLSAGATLRVDDSAALTGTVRPGQDPATVTASAGQSLVLDGTVAAANGASLGSVSLSSDRHLSLSGSVVAGSVTLAAGAGAAHDGTITAATGTLLHATGGDLRLSAGSLGGDIAMSAATLQADGTGSSVVLSAASGSITQSTVVDDNDTPNDSSDDITLIEGQVRAQRLSASAEHGIRLQTRVSTITLAELSGAGTIWIVNADEADDQGRRDALALTVERARRRRHDPHPQRRPADGA